MKLISNSMHWGWKVSLVFSVVCSVMMFGEYSIDNDDIFIYNVPLIIWVTARWISIGKQATEG